MKETNGAVAVAMLGVDENGKGVSVRIDVDFGYEIKEALKARGYKYNVYNREIWTKWVYATDARAEGDWLRANQITLIQGSKIKTETNDFVDSFKEVK